MGENALICENLPFVNFSGGLDLASLLGKLKPELLCTEREKEIDLTFFWLS